MLFDCPLFSVTLIQFRNNHPSLTPLPFSQKHVTKFPIDMLQPR